MAEVLCVYREVKIIKEAAAAAKRRRSCARWFWMRLKNWDYRLSCAERIADGLTLRQFH